MSRSPEGEGRRPAPTAKFAVRIETLEKAFGILGLLFFSGSLNALMSGLGRGHYSIEAATAGNPVVQVFGFALYAGAAALMVLRGKTSFAPFTRSLWLWALLILIAASVTWSQIPGVTARRVAGLLGTTIFAFYLAGRWSPATVVRMAAVALGAATLLSLCLLALAPAFSFDRGGNAIGAFGHKNEFGKIMVLSCLFQAAVLASRPSRRERIIAIGILSGSVIGILLTHSGTALVSIAMLFAVFIPFLTLSAKTTSRASLPFYAQLAGIVGVGYYVGKALFATVLALIGKDPTLTDRTVIWAKLTRFALDRPVFGHGYGGFWEGPDALPFVGRWAALGHAHNGYLDLILDLGGVGVAVTVIMLFSAFRRAANVYLSTRSPAHMYLAAYVLVLALFNTVGRVVPVHNTLYWVLVVFVLTSPASIQTARAMATPTLGYRRLPDGGSGSSEKASEQVA